ncbi:MAG: metal-dependent hydrolase [Gemmatimonadota bacterium]|nr:metal-dependent hydrolase [Gemmatimonadota bacterium]
MSTAQLRSLALMALTIGLTAASAAPALSQRRSTPTQPIQVRWLGHAAFELVSSGGTRIIIDPWLAQNPATPDSLKQTARWTGATTKPAAILVSHSHFDHAADAKPIAEGSDAKVVGAFDHVSSLGLPEAQVLGGNIGGSFRIGDVTVHLVPALHSSAPGGRPLGFVIEFADGRTLYHTGDTWIFGDMSLIQERYRPDIILLNVGGGPFTQDPTAAALAIRKYFRPRTIVPMHYGTFPALATEQQVRAAFANDGRLAVMRPGESRTF